MEMHTLGLLNRLPGRQCGEHAEIGWRCQAARTQEDMYADVKETGAGYGHSAQGSRNRNTQLL
eukprot:1145046-Pelagomonas_calceolata.AAC.8